MKIRRTELDDADLAIIAATTIAVASVAVLGAGAKEIVLTTVGGILALARGRRDKGGGLPTSP